MGRSQETFSKKEKEKKRIKKRQDKALKKEERKSSSKGGGLENMMAYVDEFGRITEEPPDPTKKKVEVDIESIEIGATKREDIEEDPIKKGKLIFFNDDKGYGFIREDDTQEKYFVHINNMLNEIIENDKVSFELERGPKGMNAIRVSKV